MCVVGHIWELGEGLLCLGGCVQNDSVSELSVYVNQLFNRTGCRWKRTRYKLTVPWSSHSPLLVIKHVQRG